MVFPNKGENHASGVANEKEIVKFMNKNPENAISEEIEKTMGGQIKEWNHEGGTQQKMDASARLKDGKKAGISIKNHKSGTFDWINTTKGVSDNLKTEIKKVASVNKNSDIPKKGGIRDKINSILDNYLNSLSSREITELLDQIYQTEQSTKHIIINDKKTKRLILLHKSNLDPYCNSRHKHEFILKSTPRAKTSRQIWIKSKDGNEVNTHLRIRLVLNNGVAALLGKSTKNKSSVPCLKIQQDNVDGFINKCFGKVIVNY